MLFEKVRRRKARPQSRSKPSRATEEAIRGPTLESLEQRVLLSANVPGVMPPHSNAFGMSLSEWAAEWGERGYGTPTAMNPIVDETGEFAHVNQSGKVWFLDGNFGNDADNPVTQRDITIPSGTALFVPIVNFTAWAPEDGATEQELRDLVNDAMDLQWVKDIGATLDGVEIVNLDNAADYRAESPAFAIPPGGLDLAIGDADGRDLAVADGYWLMLSPLSVGTHDVDFHATLNLGSIGLPEIDFSLNIEYDINVVPRGKYEAPEASAAAAEEVVAATAHGGSSHGNAAVQRSIQEFVDAQGTISPYGMPATGFGQVEPLADFVGWTDPANFLGISVDYAGIAADYLAGEGIELGTTFSGSVVEKPNPDGTSDVHITLHTKNALTWAIQGNPVTFWDFGTDPVVFGARALDIVENGATPSVGDSILQLKLISPEVGAPLPDLYDVFFVGDAGWGVEQVKFQANAHGFLPDGTPARISTSEVGIFNSGNFPNGHDGFPAEFIRLHAMPNAKQVLASAAAANPRAAAPALAGFDGDGDDNLKHLWKASRK